MTETRMPNSLPPPDIETTMASQLAAFRRLSAAADRRERYTLGSIIVVNALGMLLLSYGNRWAGAVFWLGVVLAAGKLLRLSDSQDANWHLD